jgi:2-polyprenyl-3-methyl-5-hydroxy-6-metoxy-1,4-benzoquinol methylase
MNCPLCKRKFSTKFIDLIDLEYGSDSLHNFSECKNCKFLWLSPTPTQKELQSFYPPHYHGFNTQSNLIIKNLYSIVNFFRFKKYLPYLQCPNSKLLDVGSADGSYFDTLSKICTNVECIGVENNPVIVAKAKKKGRKIILGTIQDLDPEIKFDLIIMNNLIEHVVDPIAELLTAKRLLKSGGKIFIETPNTNSWDFRLMQKFWGGLHTPRHTFLFNPQSMEVICKITKLEIHKIFYPINTDHWALSIQNLLQSCNRLKLKLRNGRTWYFKYLLFFFIPINMFQKIFKRTGSMEIILK